MAVTQVLRTVAKLDAKSFLKGANLMKGALVAVGAAIIAATKKAAEFEASLSKLEAISGATGDELEYLAEQAKYLGSTTASTAGEILSLQTELAKLGFTTNEILNSTGGIRNLSDAIEADLGGAAKLTGATLRQFGLDSSETGRIVDVLALSTTSSALDFEKLTNSLSYVGAAANAVGISFEETVAMLGTLSNSGLSASQAGTGLRKILIDLNDAGLTLEEGLALVTNSTDQLGTASDLVGKRAAVAFLALANGTKTTEELNAILLEASGSAKKIADVKLDNLSGDTDILKSAWDGLSTEIGEIFLPLTRVLIQAITAIVDAIKRFIQNIKILFTGIGIGFTTLWADLLDGLVTLQQFMGIDTTVLEGNIEAIRKKIVEMKKEMQKAKDARDGLFGPPPEAKTKTKTEKDKPKERERVGTLGVQSAGVVDTTPSLGGDGTDVLVGDLNLAAREEALQGFMDKMKEVKMVTDGVSSAFSDLGNNIAESLTQSMGVFGAFLGTILQGLLDIAAQMINTAIVTAASEKAKVAAGAAAAAATVGTEGVKQAAYGATATAAAVAGAAQGAAASGPAAPFVLPLLIAGALAAIGAALSGTKGKSGASRGGGGVSRPAKVNPQTTSIQSFGSNYGNTGTIIRGQQIRYIEQAAADSYNGYN